MPTRLITATNLLLAAAVALLPATDAMSGLITIAGNGPELPTMEQLVRVFEKGHLRSVVDIRWDLSSHPIELVKSGEADFAVTGQADPDLTAIPIAWDGIAVTYASLGVALAVAMYGVGVNLLVIDQVQPAEQTVKDGR